MNYAKENESIESIFYIVDDNYSSFTHIYTVVSEVIIGKLEQELIDLFDNTIMVTRSKDEFVVDKSKINYTSIHIYTDDNNKISESIIACDHQEDFIKTLPNNIEFLYNKPGTEHIKLNDEFTFNKPSEYQLVSTIKNFFARAYEVSLYINEKDEAAASLKMEEVRANLIQIIDLYIKDKYSYSLDIGEDGQRLKNTLDIDNRENFLLTFHHEDFMDIYNSLFKACVLFRKLAMGLCEKYSYPYPKEIDVKTLKVLRQNYKTLESFLN